MYMETAHRTIGVGWWLESDFAAHTNWTNSPFGKAGLGFSHASWLVYGESREWSMDQNVRILHEDSYNLLLISHQCSKFTWNLYEMSSFDIAHKDNFYFLCCWYKLPHDIRTYRDHKKTCLFISEHISHTITIFRRAATNPGSWKKYQGRGGPLQLVLVRKNRCFSQRSPQYVDAWRIFWNVQTCCGATANNNDLQRCCVPL